MEFNSIHVPACTTSCIGLSANLAMYPITVNTTSPPNKLVPSAMDTKRKESLCKEKEPVVESKSSVILIYE